MDTKQQLKELFEFGIYKLEHNLCTPSEIDSLAHLIEDGLEMDATITDLANFYGVSKDAVSSVIKRRMIQRPKRNVVLYPFKVFQSLIPEAWRVKRKKSDT